jgi:DNA-binding MarR family transcriptional regulator
MAGRLQAEIRQRKPFAGLEDELYVALLRTADRLQRGVEELLKSADLSAAQYNVLRILRGAGPEGLACREIGERMITRDPDVTRLLDRLEARRLILRTREKRDRRVIQTRISPEGLRLLKNLDEPVQALHRRQLRQLAAPGKRRLVALLERVRAGAD